VSRWAVPRSAQPRRRLARSVVLLVDPMLATGGSAIKAIETLVGAGVPASKIVFVNVVSCPEGIANMRRAYPEVMIVTAAMDKGLNSQKYIVPGLGDFGDRIFGTTGRL
jgi:uracil phosphoribosyltransferase